MKRLLGLGAAGLFLVAIAAVSVSQGPPPASNLSGLRVEVEEKNPWTHLRLNNNPQDFRFAIVSDRTGGHRAKIFSKAIERLNLLQPEFVVSVGDLIEGYTEDRRKMEEEWREFDGYVTKLDMPFFYVAGNHDIATPAQLKYWGEKYGRRHFHFLYRNVLFLMLNSEDPDKKNGSKITQDQLSYFKKALDANRNVRWTFVFLHKPLWIMGEEGETGETNWSAAEKLLAGRAYTVFAGHVHRYQKFVRQGQNYYMLATTGGGSKLRGIRHGEFDHITWVTMKKDNPIVANLMLDGVFNENMQVSDTDEAGVSTKNRKPLHPCQAKVTFEAQPVGGAMVALHALNEKTKKYSRVSDALTEENGSCVLSTYEAFDGAPEGEYAVTLTWSVPRYDETGKPTPNRLPQQYATPEKSPIKVKVLAGQKNVFNFDLKR